MPRTKSAKSDKKPTERRREFLQLGKPWKPGGKLCPAGWYLSEKLDGTRAFWDGGVSRDQPTTAVPWASVTNPKTGIRKDKIKPLATGLWSREGNPIIAPPWFLDALPATPLDGELWAGRGKFQTCRSIVSGDTWDERWSQITYAVYSAPPFDAVFQDGLIKTERMHEVIRYRDCMDFIYKHADNIFTLCEENTFDDELVHLEQRLRCMPEFISFHRQVKLPNDPLEAVAAIEERLSAVLDLGGEGVILRDPAACYTPRRVTALLKYKPFEDAEAIVTGFVTGKVGKQGNRHGRIGAVKVQFGEVNFELGTGMKQFEQEFATPEATAWAKAHPEEELPSHFDGEVIKRGMRVTFKYRELTDDGVPKEGRFWRIRGDE